MKCAEFEIQYFSFKYINLTVCIKYYKLHLTTLVNLVQIMYFLRIFITFVLKKTFKYLNAILLYLKGKNILLSEPQVHNYNVNFFSYYDVKFIEQSEIVLLL